MNQLKTEKRTAIVKALIEGNSIRATCRMTGAAKNTVIKLLRDVGEACQQYHDRNVRNLTCNKIQCDEIWSFCYAKAKNVPRGKHGLGYGDVWTWVGIDADTKLVPSWLVGGRDAGWARAFMHDLASRLAHRVQLTTDGHSPYLLAVNDAFGDRIDYATLVKLYGDAPDAGRYSPGECHGCKKTAIAGDPDPQHVSTSFVERQNLTMRMSMRRFTRLTNGFSKKLENLERAVALHFFHYNMARRHLTIKTTPAVAAGVADHEWSVEDIIALVD